MKRGHKNQGKTDQGFTLIELLISVLIISTGIAFLSGCLLRAASCSERCLQRFHLWQAAENFHDALKAKSFQDPDLQAGAHKRTTDSAVFSWSVTSTDPGLRKIILRVQSKKDIIFKIVFVCSAERF